MIFYFFLRASSLLLLHAGSSLARGDYFDAKPMGLISSGWFFSLKTWNVVFLSLCFLMLFNVAFFVCELHALCVGLFTDDFLVLLGIFLCVVTCKKSVYTTRCLLQTWKELVTITNICISSSYYSTKRVYLRSTVWIHALGAQIMQAFQLLMHSVPTELCCLNLRSL